MSDRPEQQDRTARDAYVRDVLGLDVGAAATPAPVNLRLSDKQVEAIVGTQTGVKRAQVERELSSFLASLGASQGLRSGVRVTDRVRVAGDALAAGLDKPRLAISTLLAGEQTASPADLARKIAGLLPDVVPQANLQKLLDMSPKDYAPTGLSFAGALAKLVEPGVKQAVAFLPKSIQKKVLDGLEDAVAKGLVAIADKAMDGAGLDDKTKEALHSAVEAAIKQKDGAPAT